MHIGESNLTITTHNGVFSQHHLDHATAIILRHAPQPPEKGNFLDLGCGWGPLALAMAHASPQATVYAVDINARALELTAENAKRNQLSNVKVYPADQLLADSNLSFDLIWSNPPVRIGKAALHSLLLTWLSRLTTHGCAYLVMGKNIGADSLVKWLNTQGYPSEKIASAKGFRIIKVTPKP